MKARYIFSIVSVALVLFLLSWNKGAGDVAQKCAPESPGKHFKVAFVTNNASDYWTIARKGVEKADCEIGNVEVDFKLPGQGTAAEQKGIIDDLISTGVSGIAISPVDPDNQTQLINETAKKALVITQDSDAPKSDRELYIGTDNVAAGRQAGELVKEALPNGGKIIVFFGKNQCPNTPGTHQGPEKSLPCAKDLHI